jgi:hypothetical protein
VPLQHTPHASAVLISHARPAQRGRLPLHEAAANQASAEVVKLLLVAGAQTKDTVSCPASHHDTDMPSRLPSCLLAQDGWQPLHFAAKHQASDAVVRMLLKEHPHAAATGSNVRLLRYVPYPLQPCLSCSHHLFTSHRDAHRVGSCRCTLPRSTRRRKRWWRRCWQLTWRPPRGRTRCGAASHPHPPRARPSEPVAPLGAPPAPLTRLLSVARCASPLPPPFAVWELAFALRHEASRVGGSVENAAGRAPGGCQGTIRAHWD